MGCGSSSLKASEHVGADAPTPAVPTNNLQSAQGAPVKKVQTNFSSIDYDAPAETHKGSLLKARAPDELDEGPSRNASHAGPTAAAGTGTGNLQGHTNDAIIEEKLNAEKTPPEPNHTNPNIDEAETEPKPSNEEQLGGKTPDIVQ